MVGVLGGVAQAAVNNEGNEVERERSIKLVEERKSNRDREREQQQWEMGFKLKNICRMENNIFALKLIKYSILNDENKDWRIGIIFLLIIVSWRS